MPRSAPLKRNTFETDTGKDATDSRNTFETNQEEDLQNCTLLQLAPITTFLKVGPQNLVTVYFKAFPA